MKNRKPRWKPADDAKLRSLYGTLPMLQIARKLRRPLDGVYTRASRLGLTQTPRYAKGRGRMPAGPDYNPPRLTVITTGLPPGIVSVTQHRLQG